MCGLRHAPFRGTSCANAQGVRVHARVAVAGQVRAGAARGAGLRALVVGAQAVEDDVRDVLVLRVDVVVDRLGLRVRARPVHAHALLRFGGAGPPLPPADQAAHALADDLGEDCLHHRAVGLHGARVGVVHAVEDAAAGEGHRLKHRGGVRLHVEGLVQHKGAVARRRGPVDGPRAGVEADDAPELAGGAAGDDRDQTATSVAGAGLGVAVEGDVGAVRRHVLGAAGCEVADRLVAVRGEHLAVVAPDGGDPVGVQIDVLRKAAAIPAPRSKQL